MSIILNAQGSGGSCHFHSDEVGRSALCSVRSSPRRLIARPARVPGTLRRSGGRARLTHPTSAGWMPAHERRPSTGCCSDAFRSAFSVRVRNAEGSRAVDGLGGGIVGMWLGGRHGGLPW